MELPSTTEIVLLLVGASMWLIGWRNNAKQKQRKFSQDLDVFKKRKSSSASVSAKRPRQRQSQYVELTRRLTVACLGNRDQADRLIQYEKERSPGIGHGEAIERALYRLQDDRSRS